MNTPPNALELFESSVNESLYSCFCLFVCLFFVVVFCLVFCFVFVFAFCCVLLFFILRIEKKKSGIWRKEVNFDIYKIN